MPAVILYGPPAAGKDTVTKALTELDDSYRLYRRIKVGAGRTAGYRITTPAHVEAIRNAGSVIWENQRYGALYVIDRPSLVSMVCNFIPVLHVGQAEAVKLVTAATPELQWIVTWLWCPREVAAGRLAERTPGDVSARLRAWDETGPLSGSDISINTAEVHVADTAAMIHARFRALRR